MTRVFHLVQDELPHEVIAVQEALLKHAREGRLVGSAFVALYRRGQFVANSCGLAYQDPVLTLGMVEVLRASLLKHEAELPRHRH